MRAILTLSLLLFVPFFVPSAAARGGTSFCFGDGSGTACPCNNAGASDEGCKNSTGQGARLFASGSLSVLAGDLVLGADRLPANSFGIFFQGNNKLAGGDGLPFGAGLRCVGGGVIKLQILNSGFAGVVHTSINVAAVGGALEDQVRYYQYWYRDPSGPCDLFNLSQALQITWDA